MTEHIEQALYRARMLKPSREASLVITKLEEAQLWERQRVALLAAPEVHVFEAERPEPFKTESYERSGLGE